MVDLCNEKFAKPATAIVGELCKASKLTSAPMEGPLEWTYDELWHHEGRRARHGASMSGPDDAWWHGMYDVAKTFYLRFIAEVKQVAGEPLATQIIDKYVFSQPGRRWCKEGMSEEQLQKIQEFYRERYGEQKWPPLRRPAVVLGLRGPPDARRRRHRPGLLTFKPRHPHHENRFLGP